MNSAWVWNAVTAIAAVLSSSWAIAQAIHARSPFARYEQWIRVRDDHAGDDAIRAFAEVKVKDSLVELGTRTSVFRIRRAQWIVAILAFLVFVPIVLVLRQRGPEWLGLIVDIPIALAVLIGDWRVAQTRGRIRASILTQEASTGRRIQLEMKIHEPRAS